MHLKLNSDKTEYTLQINQANQKYQQNPSMQMEILYLLAT